MTMSEEERQLIAELMEALPGDATAPASKERQVEIAAILSKMEMAQERKFQTLREVVEAAGGEMSISVRLDYEGSRVVR